MTANTPRPETDRYLAAVLGGSMPSVPGWSVRESPRRRTARITVGAGGVVELVIPVGADPADVAAMVRKRADWIARTVARHVILDAARPDKELVSGENFPLLGRNHRLLSRRYIDADTLTISGDDLLLPHASLARRRSSIIDWYHDSGRAWLADHGERWSNRLGLSDVSFDVCDLGKRWGVREPGGAVVLHWATFQLPVHLVECVLVHELAHVREPHHGRPFERLVTRLLPNQSERASHLAEAGRSVWLGEVAGPSTR